MNGEIQNDIWQFGDFRLDTARKVLWHREKTVAMPLKELELLSMLVRNRGELVTKDELLGEIWGDSFVEESNLSRHIYLLRKTLKDLGSGGLIENVPRRGYRFASDARKVETAEIFVERRTSTKTLIEFQDEQPVRISYTRLIAFASIVIMLAGASIFLAVQYVRSEPPAVRIRSIAVLPFKSMSSEPNASHVGAGMADILTTRLSSIKDLKVRPANAVAASENEDVVSAGRRLQVDAVLEGSIYYVNERVRVTSRLVNISDATVVWSGEFEKLKRDELQLQHDIAFQIIPLIAINLSAGEREAIAKKYTENPDAYALYIRGRYEWNRRNTSGIIEAQRLFRNAIAADPGFALAYVGLADALVMNQPQVAEAPVMIEKALELDPNLGEAYATLGFYQMFFEWEWQKAEANFKRSLELNPNYATAHHWYATLLAIKGETEAAKSELRQALELNPLSYNFLADLGQLHYFSGEYAEAESYCLKALEMDPDFTFAHEYLYYVYLKTGQYEKAVVEIAKADAINGAYAHEESKSSDRVASYSEIFRKSGMNGIFEYRYPGTPNAPVSFYLYATKYAFVGDSEKALDYLEKSTDARMFLAAFAKADPAFESLRSQPRYQQILRKMGLI